MSQRCNEMKINSSIKMLFCNPQGMVNLNDRKSTDLYELELDFLSLIAIIISQ